MATKSTNDGHTYYSTSSTTTGCEYFAEVTLEMRAEALKHYLSCPNVPGFERKILDSSRVQVKQQVATYVPDSCISQLELWLQREQVIKELQNMHEIRQQEYLNEVRRITNQQIDLNKAKVNELDHFISHDLLRKSQAGLAMIIRKLLELWGLVEKEQILDLKDVEVFGIFEIQKCIAQMRDQLETASTLQHSIVQHFAVENYLSRLTAISTLEHTIESKTMRSSLLREMKLKPRFMIQIGGIVLNLMRENISKIGRNVDVVDLKGKYQEKISCVVSLPAPTAFMGVVTFGNKVYVSGGRNAFGQLLLGEDDNQGVKDQMLMISMSKKTIKVLHSMSTPRSHHGMIAFRGDLWVIGGSNGKHPIATVECFDIIKNIWTQRPSLPQSISCAACVAYNDSIWVMGGREKTGKILNEVYVFDKMTWVKKSNLPVPLMLSSAIVVNNKLFLIGGVTGTQEKPKVVSEIYTYNDQLRQWDIWTTMAYPRMNHSTAFYGSYMIIAGGHTMDNLVPREVPGAVCFDTCSQDKEEYSTPMLGSTRIGLGIAMFGDPHMIDRACIRGHSGNSSWSDAANSMGSAERGAYQLLARKSECSTQELPHLNFVEYITNGGCSSAAPLD